MAHFPKSYFRKARKLWYFEINRKQINVGPDKDVAFRQYCTLGDQQFPVSWQTTVFVGFLRV
jgi:hypothetical protein